MKKPSLTLIQWIALVGMIVIGLLGGGGIWFLSQKLNDAQGAVQTEDSQLRKLTGERYLPSAENIEALEGNNKVLQAAIDLLQQRLQSPGNKLDDVKEQNPVLFKQQLAETLRSLSDLAVKNNVRVDPGVANFGFSNYQNNNPTEPATRVLGKQLVGIQEVLTELFKVRVTSLNAVRRTFDENGPGSMPGGAQSAAPGGSGAGAGSEALRARIITSGGGFYTVYPLEFEFTGSEETLRDFLSSLGTSPYVLITRFVVVNSVRANPPRLDDLAHTLDGLTKKPTFVVAMGHDDVHVRIRIDLIDWTGAPASKEAAGGKAASKK